MKQKNAGRIMQKKKEKKIKTISLTSFSNIIGEVASFYVKLPGIFVLEELTLIVITAHLTFTVYGNGSILWNINAKANRLYPALY